MQQDEIILQMRLGGQIDFFLRDRFERLPADQHFVFVQVLLAAACGEFLHRADQDEERARLALTSFVKGVIDAG